MYNNLLVNLNVEDFKSSLCNKLPAQEEVDNFNKDNSHKTGKDLTIVFLQNDMEILDYCMNEYVTLSMKEFGLNPLHYVSLPGYSFDCWLMSSGVTLDTLQDKQMLDDFVEAKKGGIRGIMGDRYINNDNSENKTIMEPASQIHEVVSQMAEHDRRSIWYIDANNLYGYAMMQKLPYKGFEYYQGTCFTESTSLDTILNTPDDSDHGY